MEANGSVFVYGFQVPLEFIVDEKWEERADEGKVQGLKNLCIDLGFDWVITTDDYYHFSIYSFGIKLGDEEDGYSKGVSFQEIEKAKNQYEKKMNQIAITSINQLISSFGHEIDLETLNLLNSGELISMLKY